MALIELELHRHTEMQQRQADYNLVEEGGKVRSR